MRAKVSFSELSSVLGYVNTILADKTVDEKMKNVIFLVEKDEVTVVGYSALTFARTKLNDVEVEGIDEDWDFQVKSAELNKIITSYSNLNKTKVDYIEFDSFKNKIKVIIHEEAIKEEDARLAQTGSFLLDSIPIQEKVKNDIHMDFPEETDSILSSDLLLYIDSLFPLMSNDSSSSLVSKLNFSNEYIFVTASYISSFFVNKLPYAFKDLTLGYSSVSFLKKLSEGVESLNVQRTEGYLCVESGMTEAFLRYQKVKVKYDPYVKRMNTDNGIVLDRLYLKDVLRRMMVSSQDGVVQMKELGLEVSNDGFTQIIPINNKKGDVENLKFKMSIPVMVKTILGNDSFFPEEVFLYFVKTGATGYLLYVKDATGGWFSTIQVRV